MLSHSDPEQGLIVPGTISIPFSYAAGKTASRFLVELRGNKRIMGVRCPECGKVWAPPQKICIHCFVEIGDWLEVGPRGRLLAHTLIKKPKTHHPSVDTLVYGLIKLDGADNSFVHIIDGSDSGRLEEGAKVEAVFSEDGTGHILDIKHFRLM